MLADVRRVEHRTDGRRRSATTASPMIAWGLGWLLAYGCLALVRGGVGLAIASVIFVVAVVASWLGDGGIRTGWERKIKLAWLGIVISSVFLVSTVAPVPMDRLLLFVGALWCLAMLLYAIATDDRAWAVVSATGVVVAGVSPMLPWSVLLTFAIGVGGPLLVLGVARRAGGAR